MTVPTMKLHSQFNTNCETKNNPFFGFYRGRTDTGVHASGAVFTVDLTTSEVKRFSKTQGKNEDKSNGSQQQLEDVANTLCSALKEFSHRPGSMTAKSVIAVPANFDARFSCLWKTYVYYISCGHQNDRSPFIARFAWQLDPLLEYDAMADAVRMLNGTHNFRWLSVVEEGELRSPIRKLNLSFEKMEGSSIFQNDGTTLLKVSGTCDFFLYSMMRRIVGVLVSIGMLKTKLSTLRECIKVQDEIEDGDGHTDKVKVPRGLLQTAPANGLCLEHVEYNIEI